MTKEQARRAVTLAAEKVPGLELREVEVFEDWVSGAREHVVAFERGVVNDPVLVAIQYIQLEAEAEFAQITATASGRLRVAIY